MKNIYFSVLLLMAAFTATKSEAATFYKWIDESGATHYSENKPETTTSEAVSIVRKPIRNLSSDSKFASGEEQFPNDNSEQECIEVLADKEIAKINLASGN